MATQRSQDDTDPVSDRLARRWSRFNDWRMQRPFLGGVLLCLAGILITWVPMQILPDLIFIGGQVAGFLTIGALFGVFVFLTGVYALYKPALSDEIGLVGVVLSIFSLFGSLGGLFVGMLLGIIGGNLCLAWKPPEEAVDDDVTEPSKVDRAVARVRSGVLGFIGKSIARVRGETGRVGGGADE